MRVVALLALAIPTSWSLPAGRADSSAAGLLDVRAEFPSREMLTRILVMVGMDARKVPEVVRVDYDALKTCAQELQAHKTDGMFTDLASAVMSSREMQRYLSREAHVESHEARECLLDHHGCDRALRRICHLRGEWDMAPGSVVALWGRVFTAWATAKAAANARHLGSLLGDVSHVSVSASNDGRSSTPSGPSSSASVASLAKTISTSLLGGGLAAPHRDGAPAPSSAFMDVIQGVMRLVPKAGGAAPGSAATVSDLMRQTMGSGSGRRRLDLFGNRGTSALPTTSFLAQVQPKAKEAIHTFVTQLPATFTDAEREHLQRVLVRVQDTTMEVGGQIFAELPMAVQSRVMMSAFGTDADKQDAMLVVCDFLLKTELLTHIGQRVRLNDDLRARFLAYALGEAKDDGPAVVEALLARLPVTLVPAEAAALTKLFEYLPESVVFLAVLYEWLSRH